MTASVEEIIKRVKRLITLPTDDTLFNPVDFTAFLNECINEEIYPGVMGIREDYFLVRDIFPLQNSSAQDLYPTGVMPIPSRAWGNNLRELKYIDSSGNYYKMNNYYLENEEFYQVNGIALSTQYQKGYIPFNSGIKIMPPPFQDNGSIEMHYIVNPSVVYCDSDDYLANTYYTAISNIVFDSSTNISTYTTTFIDNSGFFAFYCPVNRNGIFDIYNSKTGMLLATNIELFRAGSSTFLGTSIVQPGTNIISPNITEISNFQDNKYPVNLPYSPELYLVPAGINVFTPLTPVLDNLLAYELALKILSAQGYIEELQIFLPKHTKLKQSLLSQMAMRVDAEPKVISGLRGIRSSIVSSGFRRGF